MEKLLYEIEWQLYKVRQYGGDKAALDNLTKIIEDNKEQFAPDSIQRQEELSKLIKELEERIKESEICNDHTTNFLSIEQCQIALEKIKKIILPIE